MYITLIGGTVAEQAAAETALLDAFGSPVTVLIRLRRDGSGWRILHTISVLPGQPECAPYADVERALAGAGIEVVL